MDITSKQKGMTLVEIMIALILGVFIIAGVIQIFLSSKQTYRMQENLARLQENGRFAMDFISRDIRMADSLGCLKGGLADVSNKKKPLYSSYANGISGIDGSSNSPDQIAVVGVEGGKSALVLSQTSLSGGITIRAGSDFQAGDVALIADCNQGNIFTINSVSGAVIAQNVAGGQDITKRYGSDASIYPLKASIYSLGNGSRGQSSLFRALNGGVAEELVEGIEDMQILFGEDTNGDKTPDYYVPAGSGVDMTKVVSIRITLLVATVDDNLSALPISYIFNGVTATDKRLRRVFSSTIAVRNRLP